MRFWGFFVCLFMFWTFSYFLVAQRNRSSSYIFTTPFIGFPCGSTGKESAHSVGDLGLIPGLGRSPGEGKGYPLQYSCLENSMDCIVHEVTKSQTWLSDFHFLSFSIHTGFWNHHTRPLSTSNSGSRRRWWHPTPVLLPGKSHGRRSLVGCSPWSLEESDTTERLHFHFSLSPIGEGNGTPL